MATEAQTAFQQQPPLMGGRVGREMESFCQVVEGLQSDPERWQQFFLARNGVGSVLLFVQVGKKFPRSRPSSIEAGFDCTRYIFSPYSRRNQFFKLTCLLWLRMTQHTIHVHAHVKFEKEPPVLTVVNCPAAQEPSQLLLRKRHFFFVLLDSQQYHTSPTRQPYGKFITITA